MRNLIAILLFIPILAFSQGTELVTNGNFDDGSSWTAGGDWVISDGTANLTTTSESSLSQAQGDMVSGVVADSTYILAFKILNGRKLKAKAITIESTSGEDYIEQDRDWETNSLR